MAAAALIVVAQKHHDEVPTMMTMRTMRMTKLTWTSCLKAMDMKAILTSLLQVHLAAGLKPVKSQILFHQTVCSAGQMGLRMSVYMHTRALGLQS